MLTVAVVADDTDILVLLLHHFYNSMADIFCLQLVAETWCQHCMVLAFSKVANQQLSSTSLHKDPVAVLLTLYNPRFLKEASQNDAVEAGMQLMISVI